MKTIVLYYDHLFTVSFCALLKEKNIFSHVSECGSIENLHELLAKEKFTHLFIDFNMRGKDMLSLINNLRTAHKNLFIIVISSIENSGLAYKVKQKGAHAFISKNSGSSEIENCVASLNDGYYYISTDVFNNVIKTKLDNKKDFFTQREQEMLHYIASGKTIAEVAILLGLSSHTVVAHRRNMMKKSGVNNMPALIKKATDMGLI